MLTAHETGNNEGTILKMPIVFGSLGTGLTFVLKNISEFAGAMAGILTCTYLLIQIYFKLKHERQLKSKHKKHHDKITPE